MSGGMKWIKKHPLEAAALAAGVVATGGAAGMGPMAGMFAGEAAGTAGAGILGGSELVGGTMAAEPGILGASELVGGVPGGVGANTRDFADVLTQLKGPALRAAKAASMAQAGMGLLAQPAEAPMAPLQMPRAGVGPTEMSSSMEAVYPTTPPGMSAEEWRKRKGGGGLLGGMYG